MRPNFLQIGVIRIFHAHNHAGLERISFLEQLLDTFGICTFDGGQSLQISGLPAGKSPYSGRQKGVRNLDLTLIRS